MFKRKNPFLSLDAERIILSFYEERKKSAEQEKIELQIAKIEGEPDREILKRYAFKMGQMIELENIMDALCIEYSRDWEV